MMNWETHRKILMRDPEVRKAWKETRLEYEIARALILARVKKHLTQAQLAKKLKTRQSVISRVESGKSTPSLSFLKRLASVLGASLSVEFK
ncbi:MAG: Helix-turn-helix domain protein [Microgenomates group bacterium GW2011_GWC1_39_7]|nr:MAG: Helix-turn-helix domain protein [Microgenomates group bacterium GW2011_GWC1_39_7]